MSGRPTDLNLAERFLHRFARHLLDQFHPTALANVVVAIAGTPAFARKDRPLTSPEDHFAAAYAQYIAERSVDTALRDLIVNRPQFGGPRCPPESFGPVMDAFDDVFASAGLLKLPMIDHQAR